MNYESKGFNPFFKSIDFLQQFFGDNDNDSAEFIDLLMFLFIEWCCKDQESADKNIEERHQIFLNVKLVPIICQLIALCVGLAMLSFFFTHSN